jgi:hypothetical protein
MMGVIKKAFRICHLFPSRFLKKANEVPTIWLYNLFDLCFVYSHVRNTLAFALLALEVDTHVRTVM